MIASSGSLATVMFFFWDGFSEPIVPMGRLEYTVPLSLLEYTVNDERLEFTGSEP